MFWPSAAVRGTARYPRGGGRCPPLSSHSGCSESSRCVNRRGLFLAQTSAHSLPAIGGGASFWNVVYRSESDTAVRARSPGRSSFTSVIA